MIFLTIITIFNLLGLFHYIFACPVSCLCDEPDKLATCNSEQLDSVPKNFPWFVQEILLQDNNIKILNKQTFPSRQNLAKVSFKNNRIETVAEQAFVDNKNLKALIFSENNLSKIPTKSLEKCKNLVELHLDHNKLKALGVNSFNQLYDLEWLNLSNNQIKQISGDSFRGLNRLKYLNLENNLMRAIGAVTLSHLNRLLSLDISNNQLSKIHPGAFGHSNDLEELHLQENNIEEIEAGTFNTASNLKKVYLTHNNIEDPGKLDLVGLEVCELLDLSYNKLKSIKATVFKSMHKLIKLKLDHNNIKVVHDSAFVYLNEIQEIDLSFNQLTELNQQTFEIDQNNQENQVNIIQSLQLSNNKLSTIRPNTFHKQELLKELDLSLNSLETLPDGIFENNNSLETINFTNNSLTNIKLEWFGDDILTAAQHLGIIYRSPRVEIEKFIKNSHQQIIDYFNEEEDDLIQGPNPDDEDDIDHPEKFEEHLSPEELKKLKQKSKEIEEAVGQLNLDFVDMTEGGNYNNLPSHAFKPKVKKTLLLENNPYICDCNLMKFIDSLTQSTDIQELLDGNIEMMVCSGGPDKLKNKYVTDVNEEQIICVHKYVNHSKIIYVIIGFWVYFILWTCMKRKRCLVFWCCCCRILCGTRGIICRCVRKRKNSSHSLPKHNDDYRKSEGSRRRSRHARRSDMANFSEDEKYQELSDVKVIEKSMHDD